MLCQRVAPLIYASNPAYHGGASCSVSIREVFSQTPIPAVANAARLPAIPLSENFLYKKFLRRKSPLPVGLSYLSAQTATSLPLAQRTIGLKSARRGSSSLQPYWISRHAAAASKGDGSCGFTDSSAPASRGPDRWMWWMWWMWWMCFRREPL